MENDKQEIDNLASALAGDASSTVEAEEKPVETTVDKPEVAKVENVEVPKVESKEEPIKKEEPVEAPKAEPVVEKTVEEPVVEPVVEKKAEPIVQKQVDVVEPVVKGQDVNKEIQNVQEVIQKRIDDEVAKRTKEMEEKLKAEMEATIKKTVDKAVNPEAEKVKPLSQRTFEELTDDQRADILVYGKTFVTESGKRIDPSHVVENDDGSIVYAREEY